MMIIIIIKVFLKHKNLVRRDYSKRIHAHSHAHTGIRTHEHTDYAKQFTHKLENGQQTETSDG